MKREHSEEVRELLRRSEDNLAAAIELLNMGYNDISASRAYYAMFYAASAALVMRGEKFSRHSAVIASFGKLFVKNGSVDKQTFKTLQDGFNLRNIGDYGALEHITTEEARDMLGRAGKFCETVRKTIKNA